MQIKLAIQAQPDEFTCGPACLYSLYRHYGDTDISLRQVIEQIERLDHGGTLIEVLACHALQRGFRATIYSYHIDLLDPTWFAQDGGVHDPADVIARLAQQVSHKKPDPRYRLATRAMQQFLRLGGELRMQDLTPALISGHIAAGRPILAGLSATYLLRTARERNETMTDDDVCGEPQGHFVMLVGYTPRTREVLVADPLDPAPPYHTATYRVNVDRLISSVMLGIITHDANLLVITPSSADDPQPAPRDKPARDRPVLRRRKPTPK
ncbi:MAG: C39 family peptidase [Phycisphaerales bacterium]